MAKVKATHTMCDTAAVALPANHSLTNAKTAKQDEFYTRYVDIQKEVEAYLEFDPDTFRDKIVYCNCDDPFESNFFKYFAVNFNRLGLKKLITTSYDGSRIANVEVPFLEYAGGGNRLQPEAVAVILDRVGAGDGNDVRNIDDVAAFLKRNKATRKALRSDDVYAGGDFRSADCVELLKEADIVVTNPPFSLFRDYVAQIVAHDKKFLIIGNKNVVTCKNIFPLVKANRLWMGATSMSTDMLFHVPDMIAKTMLESGKEGSVFHVIDGKVMGRAPAVWFTNIDHGRHHRCPSLLTAADNFRFSKHKEIRGKMAYERYDNYDAIEVPFSDAIPSDYDGVMGVPISFLNLYNPEYFEILGMTGLREFDDAFKTRFYTPQECRERHMEIFGKPGNCSLNSSGVVNGRPVFKRILIRHRRNQSNGGHKR